jgi:ankyrin repeat protein
MRLFECVDASSAFTTVFPLRRAAPDAYCFALLSGCDLNAVDNYGDCALKKAAFSGHADFVKALLEAGANPNVCDGFMKSPL